MGQKMQIRMNNVNKIDNKFHKRELNCNNTL